MKINMEVTMIISNKLTITVMTINTNKINNQRPRCSWRSRDPRASALTDADPDGNSSLRPQIRNEDDRDDVADLVHGGDDPRERGRDLVALLYRGDDGVQVARRQGLLDGHQDRQQEHEDLWAGGGTRQRT